MGGRWQTRRKAKKLGLRHGQKPPQDGARSLIPLCENEFATNFVF
jgi:hypothetical protein